MWFHGSKSTVAVASVGCPFVVTEMGELFGHGFDPLGEP